MKTIAENRYHQNRKEMWGVYEAIKVATGKSMDITFLVIIYDQIMEWNGDAVAAKDFNTFVQSIDADKRAEYFRGGEVE